MDQHGLAPDAQDICAGRPSGTYRTSILGAAAAELIADMNQLERGFMPDRVVPRFLTTWKAVNGTHGSLVDSIEVRWVDGAGVKNLRGIGRFAASMQATRPPVY